MTAVTDTLRNGVDTEKMFATLDLIKAQPELAKFQFRATNRWIDGAHNRSTIKDFYAAGGEDTGRLLRGLELGFNARRRAGAAVTTCRHGAS